MTLLTVLSEVLLHVETRHVVVRMADFNGGDACERRMWRNVAEHDSAGTNLGAITDVDVAEQLRMGTEHHTVPDFRVTVADFVTGTAERHAVQETHVVADDGRFADDNICRMVDQQPVADYGRRMDVHAKLAADDALEHLGREVAAFFIKDMGYAVGLQTLESLEEQ